MKLINRNFFKVFFVICLSLTPILWFIGKHGVLIDGVDTNFPLNPDIWFARRFFVWQRVLNAGSDFSSSTAGLFFHFLQFVPYKLGLSLQIVEVSNLVFWFFLIVFSSFVLANLIFPKKSLPQLTFVILYSFNIYLFNTWENVKVANLALTAAIPLGLALFIALRQEKIKRSFLPICSVVIGVILSGAGINPAYIICFFIIIFLFLVSTVFVDFRKKNKIYQSVKDVSVFTVIVVLVNAFWIIPSLSFIFKNITATNSIDKLGFTNWVDSLSENTSLVNVIRMQGAWDWYSFDSVSGLPLYIPYALKYFSNPFFITFSFLVPAFAFFAFVVKQKRFAVMYIFFGIMLLLGIFLTSGTHLPTGVFFRFLLNHMPFFSLFRSPWYIFAPLVALSVAGLVGIFFVNLTGVVKQSFSVNIIIFVFICASLVYSYPLILGRIFRPASKDGFFVHFPQYVFDMGKYLASNSTNGRILSYPDDNIEKFKWGYTGVDSILNLISDREVIVSPVNDPLSSVSQITSEIYAAIKKNELQKVFTLTNKLNVGQIFYKKDEVTLSPDLPTKIKENKAASYGEWDLFNIGNNVSKASIVNCCELSYPYDESEKNLALTNSDEILVNPKDSLLKDFDLNKNNGAIIHANNLQFADLILMETTPSNLRSRLLQRDLSHVEFDFSIPQDGLYKPILQKYGVDFFGIINQGKVNVSLDGKNIIWNFNSSDDSYVYFDQLFLSSGDHKAIIELHSKNQIDLVNYVSTNTPTYDAKDGVYTILNKSEKDANLNFPVLNFDPSSIYLVELDYRQIYGNNAALLIDQRSKMTLFKDQTERMPNYPEWQSFSFYYHPVESKSELNIALVAPQTKDPLGTKVEYKNLAVYKVFTNDLFFKKDIVPGQEKASVILKKISPVEYQGEVTSASLSNFIIFNENYSPQWEMSVDNPNAKITHFTGNYFANAWYITGVNGSYKFKIYYKPQNLFKLGFGISIVTAVAGILYAVIRRRANG